MQCGAKIELIQEFQKSHHVGHWKKKYYVVNGKHKSGVKQVNTKQAKQEETNTVSNCAKVLLWPIISDLMFLSAE